MLFSGSYSVIGNSDGVNSVRKFHVKPLQINKKNWKRAPEAKRSKQGSSHFFKSTQKHLSFGYEIVE